MEAAIEKKKRDPELSNLDNRGRAWWTRRGGGRRRRRWARRPRRRGGAERGWRGRPWWGRVGRGRTRASPGTLPAARSPPPLSPRRRTSARSGTTPFLGRRRPSTVANRVLRWVSVGCAARSVGSGGRPEKRWASPSRRKTGSRGRAGRGR